MHNLNAKKPEESPSNLQVLLVCCHRVQIVRPRRIQLSGRPLHAVTILRIPKAIPAAPGPDLGFISDRACFTGTRPNFPATYSTFRSLCWHVSFVVRCKLVSGLDATLFHLFV